MRLNIKKVNGDLVVSSNQSGGVTSGKLHQRFFVEHKKEFTFLGSVAAGVAILSYLGINPFIKMQEKIPININNISGDVVVSESQSGGITAHTVNIGTQPRKIDISLQAQLKKIIHPGASINITAIMGDGEAYNFANQIKIYLVGQGYDVSGVDQSVYVGAPVIGQIIEPPKSGDNTYRIIIGNNR